MERTATKSLRIGAWIVNPAAGQISRDGETVRLEERTMRLLLCLAERAGEVVSIDHLLDQVWPEVTVSSDSVYQAVATLRRLLGDDPKQPNYIATVPRLGYRMVAAVSPLPEPSNGHSGALVPMPDLGGEEPVAPVYTAPVAVARGSVRIKRVALLLAGAVALVLVGAFTAFMFHGGAAAFKPSGSPVPAPQPAKSIAVVPFLDLTEGMKEEEFADGMTEELIDKLSKIPGLRVPAPTASFFYKGKQVPVAQIATELGVTYLLDGSVRKSGGRVRVAARLIRADNGYVMWTENYDRPFDDILMVQDDIAGEVTKALKISIGGAPDRAGHP
jgi:TolB-like protein/DNA-binding winged helix-turn-helix (wHTH) protein